jgi:hypothetical protein
MNKKAVNQKIIASRYTHTWSSEMNGVGAGFFFSCSPSIITAKKVDDDK